MWDGDLTYNDYLQRLSIQDMLIDAGYHLNRRGGLRYPSYVRTDSDGRRVRGDKYIVTANGQYCFQPPRQKLYNVISFIKEHPNLFADYRAGMSTDRHVSTGGSPTVGQIKGMLRVTPQAHHFLCFDNDKAGREFVEMFKRIAEEQHINPENVKVMPLPVWCKDWNDLLLNKTSEEYLKSIEGEFEPLEVPKRGTEEMRNQGNEEQRNFGNSEDERLENREMKVLGR